MNINYSKRAEADLDSIHDYIAKDSPQIADRVISRLLQAIAILERFPLVGRPGRVEDTRELTITGLPFIAVYHIADETEIDVIAIVHTAMRYPPDEA